MGKMTLKTRNAILDDMYGHNGRPTGDYVYLALSSTPIQPDGTGLTEPTGSGYARVSITNINMSNWNVAVDGIKTNATQYQFNSAGEDWGTFPYWALMNHVNGDDASNVDVYGELLNSSGQSTPVTVNNGDQLVVPVGALSLEVD